MAKAKKVSDKDLTPVPVLQWAAILANDLAIPYPPKKRDAEKVLAIVNALHACYLYGFNRGYIVKAGV